MAWYLRSEWGQKDLLKNKRGGGKLGLGLDDIRDTPVPVVSDEAAKQIVAFIDNRLSVCDSIEQTVDAALQQAEAMRPSPEHRRARRYRSRISARTAERRQPGQNSARTAVLNCCDIRSGRGPSPLRPAEDRRNPVYNCRRGMLYLFIIKKQQTDGAIRKPKISGRVN